MSMVKDVTIK